MRHLSAAVAGLPHDSVGPRLAAMNFDEIVAALSVTVDCDEPRSARHARGITSALGPRLTRLRDWHTEIDGLLADVESAVEALDEVSARQERADAHADLVVAAEALRDGMEELRTGPVSVPNVSVPISR
jgi:hypothetical protein